MPNNQLKNGMKRMTCEIPEELHHKAKVRAYEERKTLTQKVIELFTMWLKS